MLTPLARPLSFAAFIFTWLSGAGLPAQVFTVQVGTAPPPPTTLVNHGDSWRWRRGTNEPQADWKVTADAALDATWLSGIGGFGYGDTIATEATTISGMRYTHTSFYLRREFQITNSVDPTAELRLVVDYDDGFVAYLDGVEVRRVNVAGVSNAPVPYTSTAAGNHEASCCSSPNPPSTISLGAVGTRLGAGTHVLSFIALNDTIDSSDAHLIADLSVVPSQGTGGIQNNGLYALSASNSLVLAGSNTVAGSTRVTVNGDEASFNVAAGTWTKSYPLAPGMNRLFIAALDSAGNILASLNQDVVYEVSPLDVSGPLSSNTFWTNASQVVHVTGTVTVPTGITLTIGPGTVVIVSPAASLLASAGGTIEVQGAAGNEVFFLPATSNVWSEIAADGANSFLTIRHADINRGAVKFRNGATGLLEDSYVHEFKNGTIPIAGCTSAAAVTVRRSHFNVYHETLWQYTPMTVEDCVFENANNPSSDALDFDGAPVGSVIRRCTFRFGPQSNTDAIDIGSTSTATLIENCLMHDFPFDKGVSVGESSYAITIRNCLMYRCDSGVAVKDSCTAIVEGCTIANNDFGFRNYNKASPASLTGGGHITNSANNILWGNLVTISLSNAATVVANHSDLADTNWPGTGNISVDPLFVDAAARDYRLQPGSPCIGTGVGGTNMGVTLPVGGIPLWVSNLAAVVEGTNFVSLTWWENADNEAGFLVQRSVDRVIWQDIGMTPANVTMFVDTNGVVGEKYYYRVCATNGSGASPFSNLASGTRQPAILYVGGTIAVNTTWSSGISVVVTSSVTVASGVTLTIQPGVEVAFNQGLNLVVNGLLIAEGTRENHIIFKPNAGATSWGVLDLLGAGNTHRMVYCDLFGSTGNIDATGTAIYLDHIGWTNTTAQLVDCVSSSITLLNSYIPGGAGIEPVHFSSMPATGYALIKGNIFGAPQGYNDSVDFTGGNRPGPIVQFIDNVFLAAVDDCFDMDGTDAHIEGNIFMHVHQDAARSSTANAVSTGADAGNWSELVVVRNIFYDCDHALLLKDYGSMVFDNNTVVTIETNSPARTPAAYIQFGEPHRAVPGGRGIIMRGNILWDLHSDTPFLWFTNGTMFMAASQNIIQGTNMAFGGNSTNDPLFVNWQTGITYENIRSNLALLAGSPAKGTGPNGLDRGALVPGGASISGEPVGSTTNRSAVLTVGGPGVYAYRWKLNEGPWSAEVPLTNSFLITETLFDNAQPIALNNLTNGTYTVFVVGKNSAGTWQDTNSPTVSRTWNVGPSLDSDGDGLPDEWEEAFGLNKNSAADAGLDADGDGMTSLQEYLAGTNPTNALSRLAVAIEWPKNGGVPIQFEAQSNRSYTIQYRSSLSTGAWSRWQDVSAAPTNRTISITNVPSDPRRFYRVVTPQQP